MTKPGGDGMSECEKDNHEYEPISWRRSLFFRAASHLACRRCGKVIETGIEWEDDKKESIFGEMP